MAGLFQSLAWSMCLLLVCGRKIASWSFLAFSTVMWYFSLYVSLPLRALALPRCGNNKLIFLIPADVPNWFSISVGFGESTERCSFFFSLNSFRGNVGLYSLWLRVPYFTLLIVPPVRFSLCFVSTPKDTHLYSLSQTDQVPKFQRKPIQTWWQLSLSSRRPPPRQGVSVLQHSCFV